jgi:hypothetical protein
MSLDIARIRQSLQSFDFRKLFIQELGWDKHTANLVVAVEAQTFSLQPIAEKRGFQVFECPPGATGTFPDHPTRSKIERQVAKSAHEHIIIYTDAAKSVQKWQWVRRELGRPLARREYDFFKGHTGELLSQKLQYLAVDLAEEERITLVDVTRRARQAFDMDRVTKRFYDRFKTEHATFLKFIKGITGVADSEWYASLMLNRLMFIYFIQKKGFLDGDNDYLRNRLRRVQAERGKDKFLSFYRYFLLRLFHEGLGQPPGQRKKDLDTLLGTVPYLNGGLFDVHDLERTYSDIQVADDAFERLFDFFDAYQWHLDERPLRADNEINPDVLGYIFEKYINQKQMGAYYTKEDITGYIARNTLVPYLFNAAEKKCAIAFKPESAMWRLLHDDPDRYIYPAMRKGVDEPLPAEIAAGLSDLSKRGNWNKPAAQEHALPTETWREHVARRQRCHDLRSKLKAGGVHDINDFITYNLDICQFAEDVIDNCEGPELLRAFYHAIERVSVLDPTCGSGAFLFAALNLLEPLYEACLERMHGFLDDLKRNGAKHHPEKFSDFRKILEDVERHPNHRYFILKSIIVGNLYGVDIMEEAVEICKLRLFLKLVSQVEKVQQIEPLPDIDFNIRAGNTLIGFASLDEVKKRMEGTLGFQQKEVDRIAEEAEIVDRAFKKFRQMQTEQRMDANEFAQAKADLRNRLAKLRAELDNYLAGEYGIDPEKPKAFQKWRELHQPFHWLAEFFGIMHDGGFDVIIGNPPYVEYRKVCSTYRIEPCKYKTESAQNLYAFCVERSGDLLHRNGRFGMIIPSSAVGLDETACLRATIFERYTAIHCSTYSIRPAKLFEGVDQRLCIALGGNGRAGTNTLLTTRYHHWNAEERDNLFALLSYFPSAVHKRLNRIAQLGGSCALGILTRIENRSARVVQNYFSRSASSFLAHYHRSPRYWIRAMDFEQYFKSPTRSRSVHHFRDLHFNDEAEGKAVCAIINSTLFFFWFLAICNGRNLTNTDVAQFPVGDFGSAVRGRLVKVFADLMQNYKDNSLIRTRADCEYQEFRPSLSKSVIDEIDRCLAKHYDFTDEELDFIINYEIKYRMGQDDEDDPE